jgi:hypothetical protein
VADLLFVYHGFTLEGKLGIKSLYILLVDWLVCFIDWSNIDWSNIYVLSKFVFIWLSYDPPPSCVAFCSSSRCPTVCYFFAVLLGFRPQHFYTSVSTGSGQTITHPSTWLLKNTPVHVLIRMNHRGDNGGLWCTCDVGRGSRSLLYDENRWASLISGVILLFLYSPSQLSLCGRLPEVII